jgi:hypothetical protein
MWKRAGEDVNSLTAVVDNSIAKNQLKKRRRIPRQAKSLLGRLTGQKMKKRLNPLEFLPIQCLMEVCLLRLEMTREMQSEYGSVWQVELWTCGTLGDVCFL